MTEKLSPRTAASLRNEQHIYCAGTIAQCLHRWDKLPAGEKSGAFLTVRREGESPALIPSEELRNLAADPHLRDRWLR